MVSGHNILRQRRVDPDAAPSTNIPFLIQIIKLHAHFIAGTTVIALILGVLYFYLAARTYVASAAVLIDYKRLAPVEEDLSLANGRIDASAVQSQVTLITSRSVLNEVIKAERLDVDPEFIGGRSLFLRGLVALDLANDPAALPASERMQLAFDELTSRLTVDRKDVSYVITIDFWSREPDKAARITNAIANAYIRDQLDAKTDALQRATTWLQDRIATLHGDVGDAQRASVEYRLQNNIMVADGKFIDESQVSDLSARLASARLDRNTANAKLERIQAIIKSGTLNGGVVDEFSNPIIVDLRNTYLKDIRQADDYAVRYGSNHQSVLKLRAEAVNLQNSIFEEFKRIAQGYHSDAEVAASTEKTLIDELVKLGGLSNDAQKARVRSSLLDSNASSLAAVRDAFMSRYVESIQKESFPITEARVISRADPPVYAASPSVFKSLFGGSMIGLGFGFLVGACREAFSQRIRSRQQLEFAAGVSCLGILPKIDVKKLRRGVSRAGETGIGRPELAYATMAPFSLFAETIRSIKIAIDSERRGVAGQVIGIISAHAHEGKSMVAANLAFGCATTRAATLLIDGDIRRHTLSTAFTPRSRLGLSQLLQNGGPIVGMLHTIIKGSLNFLPAGTVNAPDFSNLMLSQAMAPLLDAARNEYRYIFIDLPPWAVVADARAIAPLIDHFILVTEWNVTTIRDVTDAVSMNTTVSNKLAGTVLNKVDIGTMERLNEPGVSKTYGYYDDTLTSNS
jgi:succinoglycan biosynthesis transport protein ExoP